MTNKQTEKSIFHYIQVIFDAKIFIILMLCVALGASYIANTFFLKKTYEISTTIIQPISDKPISNAYTQLLGVGGTGGDSMDQYIATFIKSKALKKSIAQAISSKYPDEVFKTKKSFKNESERLDYAIQTLHLTQNLTSIRTKEGAFIISYTHTNPLIALDVVNTTLKTIISLNETLNISSKKEFFVVLDKPEIPPHYSYPKKSRNIALSLIMTFTLCILIVLGRESYLEFKRSNLSQQP